MLSKIEPVIQQVGVSGEYDAYVVPGDPIGVRNLCDVLFKHVGSKDLKQLQSKLIEVKIEEIKEEEK